MHRAKKVEEQKSIERVLEFRLDASSAAYRINIDLENIEQLFSLASAAAPSIVKDVRRSVAATLDYCLAVRTPPQVNFHRQSEFAKRLDIEIDDRRPSQAKSVGLYTAILQGLLGDPNVTAPAVITFNYDTLVEEALSARGLTFNYGFESRSVSIRPDVNHAPSGIPVLKLHGSINWAYPRTRGRKLTVFADHGQLAAGNFVPEIVPPTWNKSIDNKLIQVYSKAVEVLSDAAEIYVIGFSMPPTDLHFKFLLAAGIKNNISIRRITFISPDPAMDEKVRLMFSANEMAGSRVVVVKEKIEDLLFAHLTSETFVIKPDLQNPDIASAAHLALG